MFLLPVFMQELLGFTALQSGWAMMPRSLTMMAATPIIGRLYNHVSPRILVALGVIAVAIGSWQMSFFTLQTNAADITFALIVQGLGFSLLFIPLATVALSHVDRPLIADASGLNSLVRQFGGSVGLALFTTYLTQLMVRVRGALLVALDPTRPEVTQRLAAIEGLFRQRGMDAVHAHQAALQALSGTVSRQAQVIAFDRVFLAGGAMMLLLLPLVMFLKQPATEPHGAPQEIAHAEA
jgi:DHA2 family multidrug resistance protein